MQTHTQVVCCTLSGAGLELLCKSSRQKPFDVVIVDEAAQAVEVNITTAQHSTAQHNHTASWARLESL